MLHSGVRRAPLRKAQGLGRFGRLAAANCLAS